MDRRSEAPEAVPGAEESTLEIPNGMRVACPLAGFRLREVTACPACAHFRGLADRFPGSGHPFAARYALLCAAEPVRRQLYHLEG